MTQERKGSVTQKGKEQGREESRGLYPLVKRGLDVAGALVLLGGLTLPMLGIACAVALDSRGGVLFRQTRVGKDGVPFVCFKFRTMYRDAPSSCPAALLTDADRYVTRVGRFLRRCSLDELPQLFNVLRGEMSLVGPRPLIPEEREMHRRRLSAGVYACRPGMSGLAQIRGRNLLTDREKAAFDRYYAHHMSFSLDTGILLFTPLKLLVKKEE